jgi:hypothetical protein
LVLKVSASFFQFFAATTRCLPAGWENLVTFNTKLQSQNLTTMTARESENIIKEVKSVSDELASYSEQAQVDSFLSYYDNSPAFLHISSDGKMRNYEEFEKLCSEYYTSLKQQKLFTITEKLNVVDPDIVITGWTGNIIAELKNGDTMIMNNYSVTNVFKAIDSKWKIIHSHESSLAPKIKK